MTLRRVCIAGLLSVLIASAQVATGRITGRLTDARAPCPGSARQGRQHSNQRGDFDQDYVGWYLRPAEPDSRTVPPGGRGDRLQELYQQGPARIACGRYPELNIALQVGAQTESVTVTAEAPLLESSTAATGQVVDSKRLESSSAAGQQSHRDHHAGREHDDAHQPHLHLHARREQPGDQTAAVGTRQGQSVQSIDGMPSMQGGGTTGIVPPPEILQEVKVSTAPYDASLGHFTGAQINMVTKSGTNGLHGALVFWNTNTDLNALSYFSKLSINNPATGPVTHDKIRGIVPYIGFNRYRGTIGGPLCDSEGLQRPEPDVLAIRRRLFLHAVFHQRIVHRPHGEAARRAISPTCWRWEASIRSTIRIRRWRLPAATSRARRSPETSFRRTG